MNHFKSIYSSLLFVMLLSCNGFHVYAQATPDPGLVGTYAVSRDTFDLGDLAYKPDSFPNYVELRGSVHYPTSLVGGPFPVLVLLHGRHSTVYKTSAPGTTGLSWPPPAGYQSITSFDGYDYFARTMASHGYIVISVSCNAINAADAALADRGMNARGQLMQKQLDIWNGYNTVGGAPFGTKFVGKLDMTHIGTMGHSRGGEGVIFHALLNKALGSPYGIKAVITLAPVDFSRKVMNGIPLMNVAPYCDGDVTGLSGVHFYDDARYNDTTDESPKHSVLLMGANHNFFNTVWTPSSYIAGTADDWDGSFGATIDPFCGSKKAGNGRLDTTKQKAAFNAYGAAFFRMYVGGDTSFAPILDVTDIHPPTSSLLDTTQAYVSYHPAKSKRLDINRTDTVVDASMNTIKGVVGGSGLVSATICGGGLVMPSCGISTATNKEPHRGTTTQKGMAQAALRWDNDTDYYQNEIPPAYQNTTHYQNLSFRTSVNYVETTTGKDLDFTVQLVDSAGKISSQRVNAFSGALFFQPGTQASTLPKILFNTVQIPLSQFKGVNQTKLRAIRFLFNTVSSGSILISDLALNGIIAKPCGQVIAQFSDSIGKSYKVSFSDKSIANTGDSLVWEWHFGDVASGVLDTSSAQNPVHVYSNGGTYKACLYVHAYRSSGLVCSDTVCKMITLIKTGIAEQNMGAVAISPNPARDFLNISGALPHDLFVLSNLVGQTMLQVEVKQGRVELPLTLPNGVYIARILSERGQSVQKLILAR